MNEHEKNTVHEQIKRNTQEEKLTDLLNWTHSIKKHHKWKVNMYYIYLTLNNIKGMVKGKCGNLLDYIWSVSVLTLPM